MMASEWANSTIGDQIHLQRGFDITKRIQLLGTVPVVSTAEAHRSQYGTKGRLDTKTGKYVYGYAKHMRDALPGASFIGFTGTPIEKADANTQETFGGYVSIYDIEDAKAR